MSKTESYIDLKEVNMSKTKSYIDLKEAALRYLLQIGNDGGLEVLEPIENEQTNQI